MMKKKSKLEKAREAAFLGSTDAQKTKDTFFSDDVLKHYIRRAFWMPRIEKLIHARPDIKTVKYLSLCAETAYDVRLFNRRKLIDLRSTDRIPFVFCEYDHKKCQILRDIFPAPCTGFEGRLEDISTDTGNEDWGKFWGTFPFDVINLDFWGDIHSASDTTKNTFYSIQAIILQQSMLRKPYELWITWRAKEDRVAFNVRHEYHQLIEHNMSANPKFKNLYDKSFPSTNRPADLDIQDVVNIGFLKWLLYAALRAFSVIQSSEVLVYKRKDKYDSQYLLYNFLMRMKPYEEVTMPSPACSAATFCEREHNKSAKICFKNCTNVDKKFGSLSRSEKEKLKKELQELHKEYIRETSGMLT